MDDELLISAKPAKRIIAFLIDTILNAAAAVILLIPAIVALTNVFVTRNDLNIIALFIASLFSGALIITFAIFYFVCLPVVWEGQTLGKRVMNIRVVDSRTNEGPNAKTMFLREATRILIFVLSVGLSLFASLITLCISEKHTTFHEQMSSTRVVNVNIYPENKIEEKKENTDNY